MQISFREERSEIVREVPRGTWQFGVGVEKESSLLPALTSLLTHSATLTARFSHLLFSFQIVHFARRMKGKYIHQNRSSMYEEWLLTAALNDVYSLWAEKKQKNNWTKTHTPYMSWAEGKDTPVKPQTVVPWFLSFLASLGEMWDAGHFHWKMCFL